MARTTKVVCTRADKAGGIVRTPAYAVDTTQGSFASNFFGEAVCAAPGSRPGVLGAGGETFAPGRCGKGNAGTAQLADAGFESASVAQLPAVFRGAERFSDRNVDDPRC